MVFHFIVRGLYQKGRHAKHGAFLFVGDIAVLAKDAEGRLWVVDGQHRLAAAKKLVQLGANHPATVLVIKLSADHLTLQDAFMLINCAVPVPDWLVQGTLCAVHRCALRTAETQLRKRYRAFFSDATTPRRPNASMNALTSALATAALRRPNLFPPDSDGIVAFVEYCNARLRDAFPSSKTTLAARDKAIKQQCAPLFIANDPTFDFVVAWLQDFSNDATVNDDTPNTTTTITSPQAQEKNKAQDTVKSIARDAVEHSFYRARRHGPMRVLRMRNHATKL